MRGVVTLGRRTEGDVLRHRQPGKQARLLEDQADLRIRSGGRLGGQRQRVALVHAPGILLLDEPLGARDALTRIGMQQLIESLWLRHGFSAVLVTHDVQEALVLADRVLVIEEGRIAHDIRVDLARPRQRGSAAFGALERELLGRVLGTPS
jgi:sulfonate transport system ATP-binding protein